MWYSFTASGGSGTFTSADNPLCQIPYASIFGRHAVMGVPGNPDYQPRVTEAIAQRWGCDVHKTPIQC